MIAWLKQVFAGPEGKTAEIGLLGFMLVCGFLILTAWQVGHGEHVDYGAWAISAGGLLGAIATALGGHALAVGKARKDAGSGQ